MVDVSRCFCWEMCDTSESSTNEPQSYKEIIEESMQELKNRCSFGLWFKDTLEEIIHKLEASDRHLPANEKFHFANKTRAQRLAYVINGRHSIMSRVWHEFQKYQELYPEDYDEFMKIERWIEHYLLYLLATAVLDEKPMSEHAKLMAFKARFKVILDEILENLTAFDQHLPDDEKRYFEGKTRAEKVAAVIDGWTSGWSRVLCEFESYDELYPQDDDEYAKIRRWINYCLMNELAAAVLKV
jgi:hypothetical protein